MCKPSPIASLLTFPNVLLSKITLVPVPLLLLILDNGIVVLVIFNPDIVFFNRINRDN